LLLALLTVVLVTDALLRTPGAVDRWLLRTIQSLPLPGLAIGLWPVDRLTSAVGAVTAWSVVLLVLLLARWWLPALTLCCLPAAGVVDNVFRLFLVDRARPAAAQGLRTATGTDHNAFPSGHVLGAVLFYGLLFVFADQLPTAWLRRGVRLLCGWVIATVGFGRLWYGAHWPTDVLAGYAMGGVLLLVLVQSYRWAERAGGGQGAWRRFRGAPPIRASRRRTTSTAVVSLPPVDG
jgi:undecaprenyl-diphosphatase